MLRFRLCLFASIFILLSAAACGPDPVLEADQPVGVITPTDGVIQLFNGRNLDGLYTYLEQTKYDDPQNVFTVTEEGWLRISGESLPEERNFGAVTTVNEYRDYHQVMEFKWGELTFSPRADRAMDSGLLIHAVGPDGGFGAGWMHSLEVQMIEGGTGDFILVSGRDEHGEPLPMMLTAAVEERGNQVYWKAGGEQQTYTHENRRRVNWYGRDPEWQDVLGFRGSQDVENPVGEWNRIDVITQDGRIEVYLNGIKVNEALDSYPQAGKLQLQSEGAELFIRRWELWPIGQGPEIGAPTVVRPKL